MLRILLLTISFINLTVVFGTLELVIGFNKTQNLQIENKSSKAWVKRDWDTTIPSGLF